jgi:hypothetical protein
MFPVLVEPACVNVGNSLISSLSIAWLFLLVYLVPKKAFLKQGSPCRIVVVLESINSA